MPQERVRCPLADFVALKASVAFDPGTMNSRGQGQGIRQAEENPDPDAGTLGGGLVRPRQANGVGKLGLNLVAIYQEANPQGGGGVPEVAL